MSGETQREESGWTVDTLKEYVTQRFTDNQKAVDAALVAQEKAIIKAETATEKRFESVNEFRQTLTDQTNTFMPRAESETRMQALAEKVNELTNRVNISDGAKQGAQLTTGKIYAFIGAVGVILGIIVVISNAIFR